MPNEHFAGHGVLKKAVEIGYKIMKIHEFWHFPKDQRKEGLFAPYVNSLLKYKTEASGWAEWEGQPYIPTGVFLAQITDELEGDPFVEFGSAGPKSYC